MQRLWSRRATSRRVAAEWSAWRAAEPSRGLAIGLNFAGFDDYWQPFLLGQGPAGALVAALSKERQLALEQRLRNRILGSDADRAFELRARAWAVKGARPTN